MDLQLIIAVNVIAIALMGAALAVVNRVPGYGSWVLANGAVVAVGATGLLLDWAWTGTLSALVFIPLVVAPIAFSHLAVRRANMNRMQAAASYARLAAMFHPTTMARGAADMLAAQAADGIQDKVAALRALAVRSTPEQQVILKVLELRASNDWPGVLAQTQAHPELADQLTVLEIRALGECGRIAEMLEVFARARGRLIGVQLHSARLFVLIFGGRPAAGMAIIDRGLLKLDRDTVEYWQALASKFGGGAREEWRPPLVALAANANDETVRRAAERHVSEVEGGRAPLGADAQAVLDMAEAQVEAEPAPDRRTMLAAPVTLGLAAINLAVFGLEIQQGGAENLRVLVALGGMWPPLILQNGEWWRLVTALFLHFGAIHIALNGFLLLVLGRDLEARWGSARLAIIYFGGGIASSGTVLWLMSNGYVRPAVLVGASGAIFAIFGGVVARHALAWLRYRDAGELRSIYAAGLALIVQFAIDLSIPEVSFAAHASGFLAGLAIGLSLGVFEKRRV